MCCQHKILGDYLWKKNVRHKPKPDVKIKLPMSDAVNPS